MKKNIIKKASAFLPTKFGIFKLSIYASFDQREHAVLVMGNPSTSLRARNKKPVLVRLHSQCLTGDTLFSLRCDCGDQLKTSMKKIKSETRGVIIYLNQEGRGIGLTNKIKAYSLQDRGLDTVDANHILGLPKDARDYLSAAQILKDLNVTTINLLTNNPQKLDQLEKYGIKVNKRIPLEITPNHINKNYLKTKKEKLGHKLTLV